jgi:hypothetical protein
MAMCSRVKSPHVTGELSCCGLLSFHLHGFRFLHNARKISQYLLLPTLYARRI